jgi:hypothetical protein
MSENTITGAEGNDENAYGNGDGGASDDTKASDGTENDNNDNQE